MLIRDRLGYVHQIPDSQVYGFQRVGYDGLGNPVGLPILPLITSLAPVVGDLLGNLFGKKGGGEVPPPPPPPPPEPVALAPPPMPCPPCPPCPVCPVCGAPVEEMYPAAAMGPMPPLPGPAPGGMSLMRVRPRRRFHARAR